MFLISKKNLLLINIVVYPAAAMRHASGIMKTEESGGLTVARRRQKKLKILFLYVKLLDCKVLGGDVIAGARLTMVFPDPIRFQEDA